MNGLNEEREKLIQRIESVRAKLNRSIDEKEDYAAVYQYSVELDALSSIWRPAISGTGAGRSLSSRFLFGPLVGGTKEEKFPCCPIKLKSRWGRREQDSRRFFL